MNNSRIHSTSSDNEYFFEEGCFILELLNDPQSPEISIARATVKPAVTTRLHRLNGVAERYVILNGQGTVEIAGEPPVTVETGDVVEIAPGETQRITNVVSTDLVFLAICTPRFTVDCYEDVDER